MTNPFDSRALLTNHTATSIAPDTYTNLWGMATDGMGMQVPATTDCNGAAQGIFMPFPAPTFAQPGAILMFPIPTINPDAAPSIELCQ